MEDHLKRSLLLHYIKTKTQRIEPTRKNMGLGALSLLFMDIQPHELYAFMPSYLQRHLSKLNEAVQSQSLQLWTLALSSDISHMMLNMINGKLKDDVVSMIGPHKVYKMRWLCEQTQVDPCEIEQCLCRSFTNCILQFLLQYFKVDKLSEIKKYVTDINYMYTPDVDILRKALLIHKLKLDKENPAHLSYWQSHTESGLLNIGRKEIIFSNQTYYVPHRIKKMMKSVKDTKFYSYEGFVFRLDEIREKKPSNLMYMFLDEDKDKMVHLVYTCRDLELISLEDDINRPEAAITNTSEEESLTRRSLKIQ